MNKLVSSVLLLVAVSGAFAAWSLVGCDNTKNGPPAGSPADAANAASAPAASVPKAEQRGGGGGW
jgi:hypothetical protein